VVRSAGARPGAPLGEGNLPRLAGDLPPTVFYGGIDGPPPRHPRVGAMVRSNGMTMAGEVA
jgi:hypothetical protein